MIFEKLDISPTEDDTNLEDSDKMEVTTDEILPQKKDVEVYKNLSALLTDIIGNIDDDR